MPRLGRIKRQFPQHALVASIMAGSGNDTELRHWQELALACEHEGCDALELNLSCPHMDRPDMGSNVGKDKELVSIVTKVVKEVANIPVWAKLTPSTTDIVVEARGAFLGGADAIASSNTFTSLPLTAAAAPQCAAHARRLGSPGGAGGPRHLSRAGCSGARSTAVTCVQISKSLIPNCRLRGQPPISCAGRGMTRR